jgi:hypothetical protein
MLTDQYIIAGGRETIGQVVTLLAATINRMSNHWFTKGTPNVHLIFNLAGDER